mmetsp:Transcript_30895/g.66205  ORF Transcript_30895/g.66205 Transcript_30895/m.66205 type:complete len:265 (+) Transcript_30895:462-1256(+)
MEHLRLEFHFHASIARSLLSFPIVNFLFLLISSIFTSPAHSLFPILAHPQKLLQTLLLFLLHLVHLGILDIVLVSLPKAPENILDHRPAQTLLIHETDAQPSLRLGEVIATFSHVERIGERGFEPGVFAAGSAGLATGIGGIGVVDGVDGGRVGRGTAVVASQIEWGGASPIERIGKGGFETGVGAAAGGDGAAAGRWLGIVVVVDGGSGVAACQSGSVVVVRGRRSRRFDWFGRIGIRLVCGAVCLVDGAVGCVGGDEHCRRI